MKYTHEPSTTTAKMKFTLDEKDLETHKKAALETLAKQVKAPGFRAGKTPSSVAEKHIDSNTLQSEVLDAAVNKAFIDAIIETKLQPLGRPQVNIIKFAPYSELEFEADLEIVPEIKLADYKKMKKNAKEVKVSEEDIKAALDRLQQQSATKEDVERAAKKNDEVLIDFSGKDTDGKDVPGASGKDYPLELGSKTFIDGFEEKLIGMKAGDEKEFTLTFPKDYGHAPLANKDVTFKVKINKVKEVKKPELNDEFAKKVADLNTLDELKEDIKNELSKQEQDQARQKLKNEIVEEIAEASEVSLPEILINDQREAVKQDFIQNLSYRGQTLEDHLKDQNLSEEEWVKKEIDPIAKKRVKTGLILSDIARAENIEATDNDVAEQINSMYAQIQDPKMREQLGAPEVQRDIKSRLTTEKTLDFLLNTITSPKK